MFSENLNDLLLSSGCLLCCGLVKSGVGEWCCMLFKLVLRLLYSSVSWLSHLPVELHVSIELDLLLAVTVLNV